MEIRLAGRDIRRASWQSMAIVALFWVLILCLVEVAWPGRGVYPPVHPPAASGN